jgi:ribonuclease VapC
MVIDASALVAILLEEAESPVFLATISQSTHQKIMSPVSIFESVAAVARELTCTVQDARFLVSDLATELNISIADVTPEIGEMAITAFDRFGKGRHPAQLNMGDCYTYALAKTMREPLLVKGRDFSQTDIECVI